MPILSMFYGIVIRMYFNDDKQHHVPHLHAPDYAGQRAVFNITNGELLAGELPAGKSRLVVAGSKYIAKSCWLTGNWP